MKKLILSFGLLGSIFSYAQKDMYEPPKNMYIPQPIYVVDNVVTTNNAMSKIESINIKSINIVKDPSYLLLTFKGLDNLSKRGIIFVNLKQQEEIPSLQISQYLQTENLPADLEVYLDNKLITDKNLRLSKELLTNSYVVRDSKTQKPTNLSINTTKNL